MTGRPRLFRLERDTDHSGVSGSGHVADGVIWADGTVTLRWFGAHASTVNWDSIDHAVAVHGQGGDTRFVYDDTLPATAEPFNGLPAMLRTRREALGLSQRGAAEQIGISFSTVSRVEAGQQPELAPLIKVLDWLGMRIGWVAKEACDA
jgi:DNA-binding XRE family transcriptional regulator